MHARVLTLSAVILVWATSGEAFSPVASKPFHSRARMTTHASLRPSVACKWSAAGRSAPLSLQMVASRGKPADMVVEGPFPGKFGTWVVDEHDATEVMVYRSSLVAAALSVAAGASMAVLPEAMGLDEAPAWAFDVAAAAFFASFGVSLSTIHIYMKVSCFVECEV
jgi:hypothetical protein